MSEKNTIPNKRNFCGGNFQDWLEVMLLPECNANCQWCVEKGGFRPGGRATWRQIADSTIVSGKKNIILLGGEPTLYPHLQELITALKDANLKIWLSTNGSKLNENFVKDNLKGLDGINISIHCEDPLGNMEITGLNIQFLDVMAAIDSLTNQGTLVRMNCNLIKGYVDSRESIEDYVRWTKMMGADRVRFAELKGDEEKFVDACEVMGELFGLSDDPFTKGCQCDTEIEGVPVNFRQMCGLQTKLRPAPVNPVQYDKKVLYYDGNMYPGWMREPQPGETVPVLTTELDSGSFEDFTKKVLAFTDPKGTHKRVERVYTEVQSSGCMY